MDDRLDLMDQGSFLGLRALGHHPCTVLTWWYERPVDLEALSRFNDNLVRTLLGRLVQPSPVPGGRHRWVALESAPALEVEARARSRDQVLDWTNELADRGVDPEHGPGWRIGVLPLDDGGTVVTMVGSHTLGDGLCKLQALSDAVTGVGRRPAYRRRGSRGRVALWWADGLALVRELPAVMRAVVAAARLARAQSGAKASPRPIAAPGRPALEAGPFHAPAACVRISRAEWDAAAEKRGGTSNSLLSAVAARLGVRLGRVDADGTAVLAVPVSNRVEQDTRANALDQALIEVDPSNVVHDLGGVRAATKAALSRMGEDSHQLMAALPLVPLTPPFVVRRAEQLTMASAVTPIGCSNHGDLPAEVMRIDGGDPDDFWIRLGEPGQTAADLDRIGGQLYVLGGRALGLVYVSVLARPVGGGLDREELLEHVIATLAEFGLTAVSITR